jgi:hypothetical protein
VLAFVKRHGVVLVSAKGPVPNVADWIAGEAIEGSWWGHAKGQQIFAALTELGDSPDVLTFRLVDDKLTMVHRRLWPALVRLADRLPKKHVACVRQEHTSTGAHRNVVSPFPKWVPREVMKAAYELSKEDAEQMLGPWLPPPKRPNR